MADVYAQVNWGRWIAPCWNCTGAEDIDPSAPTFTCMNCGMPANVIMPPDPAAVDAVLEARPSDENKNWLPDETIEDLQVENAEHGV